MAAFNHSNTADYVSRSGEWHHIAVTWTARGSGRTRIYQDGLLMAEVAPFPLLSAASFGTMPAVSRLPEAALCCTVMVCGKLCCRCVMDAS